MTPFISIIFPNWNGKENTLKLLESLEALNYDKKYLEIICVDNGSTDGSQNAIKIAFQYLSPNWAGKKIIELDKNYGAVYAYNKAFHEVNNKFGYLWKLDNDIILDPESLNALIDKFARNSKLGIAGSIVFPLYSYEDFKYNQTGPGEIGCKINFITTNITKKTISYQQIGEYENNVYRDITYSIGCSNLIKREILDTIGFLDNDFFLYYDDSYFSYMTRKNGFDLATSVDSIVYHKGSASTGGIMKPLGIYYTTLSENIFFYKTMPLVIFCVYYPLIFIKRLGLTLFRLPQVDWNQGFKMFIKAHKQFLLHRRSGSRC